jgi:hypothetical protein
MSKLFRRLQQHGVSCCPRGNRHLRPLSARISLLELALRDGRSVSALDLNADCSYSILVKGQDWAELEAKIRGSGYNWGYGVTHYYEITNAEQCVSMTAYVFKQSAYPLRLQPSPPTIITQENFARLGAYRPGFRRYHRASRNGKGTFSVINGIKTSATPLRHCHNRFVINRLNTIWLKGLCQ